MTNENLDESWKLLEDAIADFGDSHYSIELRSSPNSGRNNPLLKFVVGAVDDAPMAVAPRAGRGFGSGSDLTWAQMMMPFMTSQIGAAKTNEENLRDQNIKLMMQLAELKNEAAIAKVREETAVAPDHFDRFLALIETPAGGRLLDRLTGSSEARAAIGTMRAESGAKVPPAKPSKTVQNSDGDEADEFDLYAPTENISVDHLINCTYRLKEALPDINMNALFEKIAQKAEAEPGTIRNLIQFL